MKVLKLYIPQRDLINKFPLMQIEIQHQNHFRNLKGKENIPTI